MVNLAQSESRHLIDHPNLVNEWHPIKNGRVKPEHLSANSYRKVWWQCSKNPSHEWKESAHYRTRHPGCPICDPSCDRDTAVQTLLLQIKQPVLNPLKVIEVTQQPLDAVNPPNTSKSRQISSTRKPKDPQQPMPTPLLSTSLATCAHYLVPEFHPARNAPHNPDTIAWNSRQLIWWQCGHDASHEWKDSPYNRTQKDASKGCPLCAVQAETEFKSSSLQKHRRSVPRSVSIAPTQVSLLFIGMYWITGGTGVAACTLQSSDKATTPVSHLLRTTSYTGSHWAALLIGLQKLLEDGFRGEVVAVTNNPNTVQYMNQVLRTPSSAKSKSAADAALRVKTLISSLEGFEIRVCSTEEIQPVIGLAQFTLDTYLKSLLEDNTSFNPFPLPSVPSALESLVRLILDQPYPSDTDLEKLEQVVFGDKLSRANYSALSKSVPKSIREVATKVVEAIVENNSSVLPPDITPIQATEDILRWYLRGLPIALAIRKALLFVQSCRRRPM